MTYFPPNLKGDQSSTWIPDPASHLTGARVQVGISPQGQLESHAEVITDAGSFRDDFTGTSLTDTLTGGANVTFTSGGTTVTGVGTSFTTQIHAGDFVKKASDSETFYAEVASVDSDTSLTLVDPYGGTTATTTGVVSDWKTTTATGGSITVGSSIASLTSGTTSGQSCYLQRSGDFLPYTLNVNLTISQRIANQTVFVGFRDQFASPNFRAEVSFSGTNNTQVTFVSSGGPNPADTQTTTTTLPINLTTASPHQYKIDVSGTTAVLSIDGTIVATHETHLPGPYDTMGIFAGVTNTGTAASSTTIGIDSIYWLNTDRIQIDQDFKGEPLTTLSTIQPNIVVDANNSSTANLASGATFTGAWSNTLTVASLYFNFYSDQPCTIYIDQSSDGTNADITDSYSFNPLKTGIGWPISAASNFWRIRVTNNGSATTTSLRLNAYQVATQETLPRSLDTVGNLKVAVQSMQDQYGYLLKSDPMGALRVEQPYRLTGASFGSAIDSNFWVATTTGTGSTSTVANGFATVQSTTTNSGYGQMQSSRIGRFVFAHPHLFRSIIRLANLAVANTSRYWGAFTVTGAAVPQDGFYFSYSAAGVLSVNYVNNGSVVSVASGSFNGDMSSYTFNSNAHTCEIIFFLGSAKFFIDQVLIHTFTPTTTMLSSTFNLPATFVSSNPAGTGAQTQATLEIWAGIILRLGRPEVAPIWRNIAGANAGVQLKTGPGVLRNVILNSVANGTTVTLYDAVSATNPIATVAVNANTGPVTLNYDADFYTGLFVVTANAATNVTIVYE